MNLQDWGALEDKPKLSCVLIGGAEVKPGCRVRLRPKKGGDAFDFALAGRFAVIESIEQDYEEKIHLAVILDDDPGKDLGLLRQPGHRFFFSISEVEPLETENSDDYAGG
jgi:hypothetical protein